MTGRVVGIVLGIVGVVIVCALLAIGAAAGLSHAMPQLEALVTDRASKGGALSQRLIRNAALNQLQSVSGEQALRHLGGELQWHRQTFAEAYDEVGRRSPKWDDTAHEALDLAAQIHGIDPARSADALDRFPALLETAVAAGCDDPMIVFLHRKFDIPFGREAEALANLRVAATQLDQSTYPPFRRALALAVAVNAGSELPSHRRPPRTPEIALQDAQFLDRAVALLPEVLHDTLPDRQLKYLVLQIIQGRKRLGLDRWDAFQALVPTLTKARGAESAAIELIKGMVLIDYAWDARGHD
jgi:hypothetical protein